MTADLDKLDALAAAAQENLVRRLLGSGRLHPGEAEFVAAACDPATIRDLVAAARERDDEQGAVMRVYEAMDKYREEQAAKGKPTRPGWFLKLVAVISYERLAALHRKDGAST